MSRSVSTHPYAIATVYLSEAAVTDNGNISHDRYAWDNFLDDLRNTLTGDYGIDSGLLLNGKPFTGFDGYESVNRWEDRETQVILQGELTEISVSEYNGVVAICLAPLEPSEPSHRHACEYAAPFFNALLKAAFPSYFLKKIGTFSNGESVYERNQEA